MPGCPLIKAALGDAAGALERNRDLLDACPLIKAALGDAAGTGALGEDADVVVSTDQGRVG